MIDELIQIAVTTNIHNISEMKPKIDAKRDELESYINKQRRVNDEI